MIKLDLSKEDLECYDNLQYKPNVGWCAIRRFMFTTGLCYGIDNVGYAGRFCYENHADAKEALNKWDGTGVPKDDMWIKHKGHNIDEQNPLRNEIDDLDVNLASAKVDVREEDIQKLCNAVLNVSVVSTGDSGSGGMCPFCYKDCSWNDNRVSKIDHETHCPVLIAKDLSTGLL